MNMWTLQTLLISAALCLSALPLVSCGDDGDSSGIFAPSNAPRINNFFTTSQAIAGNFTSVTQSVSVPAGIPFSDDAFSLIYISQAGGNRIETVFSAADIDCVAGATSCSSTFQPQVPADLPVLPAEYLVTFTVIDQAGRVAQDSQFVFINP